MDFDEVLTKVITGMADRGEYLEAGLLLALLEVDKESKSKWSVGRGT